MTAWAVAVAVEASHRATARRRVVSRLGDRASRERHTSGLRRAAPPGDAAASSAAVWSRLRDERSVRVGARRRREHEALLDLLDDLAVAVSGGASLGPALVDASASAAAHRATRSLGADLLGGTPFDRAVERWCQAFAVEEARSVATTLAALVDGGADAAGPIDRLGEVVRQQIELDDEVRSAMAPATASAVALSVLPVLGVVAIAAIEPNTARWLVATPAGLVLVAMSAGWNALGWAWMRHTTASVSP